MNLSQIHKPEGATHPRKRVGRGMGSGHGKTSTRGHKGQRSRSGHRLLRGFEGGQMPIHRRLPKRGFHNLFRKRWAIVNLDQLAGLGVAEVSPKLLLDRGLIHHVYDGVKILGRGELTAPVQVTAHAFTASAKAKIEAAGGKAHVQA
ncbi:MAG: 50S ribosomal protein L15 [Acidobacteria bacterium]|nr:MAG: 50S ribosomal protein L15 [Acidobacteriota bacterium]